MNIQLIGATESATSRIGRRGGSGGGGGGGGGGGAGGRYIIVSSDGSINNFILQMILQLKDFIHRFKKYQ